MRALTIRQPWAWMIAAGHKRVEWRSWYTGYRGRFAIHAGNQRNHKTDSQWIQLQTKIVVPRDLTYGAIIATATLVGVARCSTLWPNLSDTDRALLGDELGLGVEELYGFVLDEVQSLPCPIPQKGALGWWRWLQ